MTMVSHLAELERRHQALEREIDEITSHPASDDLELSELKKQKLLLKDQIEQLKSNELH